MKRVISTDNATDTEAIAEIIGRHLRGGEVIELVSDLGGGKTTFVRGLARGAGSSDHVSSPTFTISHLYKAKKCDLYHFDFYRLPEAGLIEHELQDVLSSPKTSVVVEWSNVVKHVLPKNRLTIHIKTTSEETRQLTFDYPKELAYLVDEL